MKNLNSNIHFTEKPLNNTYFTNPEFSKNISDLKTAYTSFPNSNQNIKLLTGYEKYKNQKLLNSAKTNTQYCHKCHPHHFHIHHIHIPQERLYEALNLSNLNLNNTSGLMKEVLELKNECKKFREELIRNQREKVAGDLYIKELENKNFNNNKENNFNRYHDMLDKSFEILNSVSKKCDDENAKTKGGIYYYQNKNNDYNKLIKAQKDWIDNLPENKTFPPNIHLQNVSPSNRTYQINNQLNNMIANSKNKNRKTFPNYYNPYEHNKIIDSKNNYKNNENQIKLNDEKFQNKKNNKLFFDSKRNNNKGYIIKKGEIINYNNNSNEENDINLIKNNYNIEPNINNKNISNRSNNKSNNNSNSSPLNNNFSNNKENENNNENILINNEEDKEEVKNPLNERFLIIDENGDPILINGKKLLGMELLPLIDEDGKEVIDDNGNIILIGPNGDPRSQDELEPIIINNELILVNEEKKPFLGLDGVPLINDEGNPITGPDDLLEKDNKEIKYIIGYVAKDSKGNPIKVNIKDNNKEHNKKNKIKNNSLDYNKLKPLLDLDGKPILDSNNNFIILDQNNKPVENKDIKVLLSKDGTPILNGRGKPILTDRNEKPLNNEINKIDIEKFRIRKDRIRNRRKQKKERNPINYSECNPESLKKINFLRPDKDPYYDDLEYKGSCFACDVGCSVSKSGYSIMNYSPYNNLIKRRNITPIKINEYEQKGKRNFKKDERNNYKRYYLS